MMTVLRIDMLFSSVCDAVGRRSGGIKVTPRYKKVPNPNLQKYIPSFKIIPPYFFPSYAETILEFLEGRDGRMVDKVSTGILQGYVYWVTGNNGHIIVDVLTR